MTYKNAAGQSTADGDSLGMSCRVCNTPTSRATLSAHGGQCLPCFAHHCREMPPQSQPTDSPALRDMRSRLRGNFRSPL